MPNYKIFWIVLLFYLNSFAQKIVTLITKFDACFKEMSKTDVTHLREQMNPGEKLGKSVTYKIDENHAENGDVYQNSFSHHDHGKKNYEKFGGKPPLILRKPKSYLKNKEIIGIKYFKTASNHEAFKLFQL